MSSTEGCPKAVISLIPLMLFLSLYKVHFCAMRCPWILYFQHHAFCVPNPCSNWMNSMVNNEATHLLLPILKETLTNLTEFYPSTNPMRAKSKVKWLNNKTKKNWLHICAERVAILQNAQIYLQPNYGNGVLGSLYLSVGQH